MTTSASMPRARRLAIAAARPPTSANSGQRALPSTVPPAWMMPPTSRAASWSNSLPRSPAKPLRTANTSQPRASAPRVTARTAAFMPAASPPLVRTAIFFKPRILTTDDQDPEAAPRRRARLPELHALGQRHPDGVRRRRPPRARDTGGRAARRRGGQEGPALRRAGRKAPRQGAHRGRRRSRASLRHQRGEAFQVAAPRQAAAAQDAGAARDRRLPPVARRRDRRGEAARHRVSRLDRGQGGDRQGLQG